MILFLALACYILILLSLILTSRSGWRTERFRYWLGGGLGLSWLLALLSRPEISRSISLSLGRKSQLLAAHPTLLLDPTSWTYASAFIALALTILLTQDIQPGQLAWTLGLLGAGIAGVMSGNILALLFSWVLYDILWFVLLLRIHPFGLQQDRFLLSFTLRMAGPILALYGAFLTLSQGGSYSLQDLSSRTAVFLLAAGALRCFTWVPRVWLQEGSSVSRSLPIAARTAAAGVSWMLATRVAAGGVTDPYQGPFLFLSLAGLLLFGLMWAIAPTRAGGHQSWMVSFFTLGLGAALQIGPAAVAAWGIAALLPGNMLFLSPRLKGTTLPLAVVITISLGGLPFTPLWQGSGLFSRGLSGVGFAAGYGVLIAGLVRYVFLNRVEGAEALVWKRFPVILGLAVLPLTQVVLAWPTAFFRISGENFPARLWVLFPFSFTLLMILIRRLGLIDIQDLAGWYDKLISYPDRFTQFLLDGARFLSGLVMQVFRLLEGRGGVIWALLGLFFLLSMLAMGVR